MLPQGLSRLASIKVQGQSFSELFFIRTMHHPNAHGGRHE
jgi:hypothetical protein